MKYDEMSDFEINKAVAESLGFEINLKAKRSALPGEWVSLRISCNSYDVRDYCNNINHAWPIILENGLGVKCLADGDWMSYELGERAIHRNPLRAAMIVYLSMMEDVPNEL